MNFKYVVLTGLIVLFSSAFLFARSPKNCIQTTLSQGQTSFKMTTLAYDAQRASFKQYPAYLAGKYDYQTKKCLTSKIGRGMMIGGGGLFVGGLLWVLASPKHPKGGFDVDLGPDEAWMTMGSGLGCVALGGVLATIGGIYNVVHKSNRYSIISTRKNEIGISYTFR